MKKTYASIHVLNADIEEVRSRLSSCQVTSALNQSDLEEISVRLDNAKNTFSKTVEIIRFLKKKQAELEKQICFYVIEKENQISIFSEYITANNVFKIASEYFADLDNYVIAFDLISDQRPCVEVTKGGQKTTFIDCDICGIKNMTDLDEIVRELESFLDLSLTPDLEELDVNSPNVYIDEYIILEHEEKGY